MHMRDHLTAKVSLDPDKGMWHPSPLIGQIVLVTTLNADGTSNVAPKSWISMMAFEPSLLALGCNVRHWTGRNILERKEFVINVPGAELAEAVWRAHTLPHPRPVEAAGLTPIPSLKVRPPRVEECRAHVECVLDQSLAYGDELIALGRIVAVSVDEAAMNVRDPYTYLRMFVYLESGTFGVVECSHILAKV
jgi:flavin reductase (DIM6/NTAB) family NADH-FMN oxidoreductase RutF